METTMAQRKMTFPYLTISSLITLLIIVTIIRINTQEQRARTLERRVTVLENRLHTIEDAEGIARPNPPVPKKP